MADGIFKNHGRINAKSSPTGFSGCRVRIYCRIYKIQYGGSKLADEFFKNHGRINTKSSPTGFSGRRLGIYCRIYKIQYGG